MRSRSLTLQAIAVLAMFGATHELLACTGVTLKAKDGAVVYGRTMEWGSFDLHSRVVIVPDRKKIDFASPQGLMRMPMDKEKTQDFDDVTPAK